MINNANHSNKIIAAEGIRGVASLIVIFHHLALAFFPTLHNFDNSKFSAPHWQVLVHDSPFAFIYSGTFAVFVFFLLSGYILTHSIHSRESKNLKIISMCLSRYLRLMVPVLCICLLGFFCFALIEPSMDHLPKWISGYGHAPYSLIDALYSGTIDVFFISGESHYNPALWTMKLELFGSFLIFFLCWFSQHKILKHLPWVFLVVFVYLIENELCRKVFGLGLVMFLIGYGLYFYGIKISTKTSLLLFIAALYFAGAHNTSNSYQWLINLVDKNTYLVGNFISGFLFVYCILLNSTFSEFFARRFLVYMGKVSFSTYLLHMPLLYAFGLPAFNWLMDNQYSYLVSALLGSGVTLVMTYLLANFYYRFIDRTGIFLANLFSQSVLKRFHRPVAP